jgi:ribosomal protein S6
MDTVKRNYELTYILSGVFTDSEVAQNKTQVEQILKKFSAQVLKNEDWGRRPLAYTIVHEGKKQNEGVYTHVVFALEPSKAPTLEREIYLSPVMRHLLVQVDEVEEEVTSEE